MIKKIKDIHTNPVFAILTKNARPPLWRGAVIGAGAIAAAVLLLNVTTAILFFTVIQNIDLSSLSSVAGPAIISSSCSIFQVPIGLYQFILPAIVAGIAALMTRQIISGEEHSILRTTSVGEEQIIKGLVGAIFYRLRYPYAIALGLMFTTFGVVITNMGMTLAFAGVSGAPDSIAWMIALLTLQALTRMVRIIGISPLAAMMGVVAALKFRQDNSTPIGVAVLAYLGFEVVIWLLFSALPSGILMAGIVLNNYLDIISGVIGVTLMIIRLLYLPAAYLLYRRAPRRV